ncbi:small ribosomal subunit protein bS6m [Larus michahellis]|uniref:small ribosomal subunit protein bS6m n=1 Tax=Larus michahellis TaxID=119627 RepID=UPI003D9AC7F2
MQVAVGSHHSSGWPPVSDVLLTEGISVTDLDGRLASTTPRLCPEHPLAGKRLPRSSLTSSTPASRPAIFQLCHGPSNPAAPRVPTPIALRLGPIHLRSGRQAQRPPQGPWKVLEEPRGCPTRAALPCRPLPAPAHPAATAAAAAAAGRRKAGAGPEPPQGWGGGGRRRPRRGPPGLGPLPGGGHPPTAALLPPPPSPRAGAVGQPPGGRRPPGGQACARRRRRLWRAGGGAAEPAQLPAPFKPRRPPARLAVCAAREQRGQEPQPGPPGTHSSSFGHSPLPTSLRHRRPLLPTLCPAASLLFPPQPSSKMPRYELALILKAMQRPETAAVLKRTVETLMERGAIVRNLENLGERSLPYKISKHKERHRRGGYFLIDLEGPPSIVSTMMDHLGRDIDVIRRAFIKHPVSKTEECSGIIPVNYEDKLIAKKK